jgi:peptide/nickel transport system permease protein
LSSFICVCRTALSTGKNRTCSRILALAIISEATLSFLGVGAPPTQPSLGTLIRIGQGFLFSGEWWILFFPAVTLLALALSVNLLGDWLRDVLNPRLR